MTDPLFKKESEKREQCGLWNMIFIRIDVVQLYLCILNIMLNLCNMYHFKVLDILQNP